MYLTTRIFAGIAMVTLAGAAVVATGPAADAATQACGSGCVALAPGEFGTADVASITGLVLQARHATIASAGQHDPEDFTPKHLGMVWILFKEGIVNNVVARGWPGMLATEYQYTPDGNSTGLCLGVPETPAAGTVVSLYPCGVTSRTIWIGMAADEHDDYEPMINAAQTNLSSPYVLTAGAVGAPLTTAELSETGNVPAAAQTWQDEFGVL